MSMGWPLACLLHHAPCRARPRVLLPLRAVGHNSHGRRNDCRVGPAAFRGGRASGDDSAKRSLHIQREEGIRFWTLPDDGRRIGTVDGRTGEVGLGEVNRGALSGDTNQLTGMTISGGELYGVANGEELYEVSRETGRTTARKLRCRNCGGGPFALFSLAAGGREDGATMFASGLRARRGGKVAGLFRVDPGAGEVEWVARHRRTGVLLDLAMSGTRLYGVSFENRLYEIATTGTWSGEATAVGDIDGVSGTTSGISFAEGALYAIDYGPEPSRLYVVDPRPCEGRCCAAKVNPGVSTGLDLSHVLASAQECG